MLKIFCSHENLELASELAKRLALPYEIAKEVIFNSNEKLFYFELKQQVSNAIIFHSLWPDTNNRLLDLLLILDSLKSHSINNVTLIIPFIPYLRQDRELVSGSSIGSRVIASLLDNDILKKIITISAHSNAASNFFKQEFISLECSELFGQKILPLIDNKEDTLIIAPDKGSIIRAQLLSNYLDIPFTALDKSRENNKVIIKGFSNNTTYKTAIIIDDIVDSGNTLVSTLNLVNNYFEKIFICISHCLNNNIPMKLKSFGDHINFVTTNSINCFISSIEKENIIKVIAEEFSKNRA